MPRININEYAYIDYKIEPDGSINITEKHNIPNGVIYYDDGVIYLKNGMQWKEILKFDEKLGEFKWLTNPLEFITSLELTNTSLDDGTNKNYTENRKRLNEQREHNEGILEGIDTERDLHTHFVQVLSAEQLLDFLKSHGIKSIYVVRGSAESIAIVSEEDYLNLTPEQIKKKYNCVEMDIEKAKENPNILSQLSAPLEENFDKFNNGIDNFKYFDKYFQMRTAILNLACCGGSELKQLKKDVENIQKKIDNFDKDNKSQIEKYKKGIEKLSKDNTRDYQERIEELKEKIKELENKEFQNSRKEKLEKELNEKKSRYLERLDNKKKKVYRDLLTKSLEVLKTEHGVNYVEFSYSNTELIKAMIEDFTEVDGIDFKFLISQHRSHKKSKGPGFIATCEELSEMTSDNKYKDKIAGFDLMGMEEKIVKPYDFEDSGEKCNTLHTKLKYAITGMLIGSINSETKPTLRLHAGEIYHEDNPNPNLTLEILKQIEDEIKDEYGRIYTALYSLYNNNTNIEESINKDSLEYKIVCNAKKMSKEELEAEIKRVEYLKDHFCLKDRLEIRIGHGLHFEENEKYYERLRHFGAIVELCPSSNTKLGNLRKLEDIPYDKYVEKGIPVVVGTDGEGYFRDSMKQEASLVSIGSKSKRKNATASKNPPTDSGKSDKYLGYFIDDWGNASKSKNAENSQVDSGLDMDITIDEYMSSINKSNSKFMNEYDKADGKKAYVNNYFRNLYVINGDKNSREIERLKIEIGKTFNFIMDMQSNELYFNNFELQLIKKSLERIERYFKEEKYVKAAILLVSLQGVMGYQTDLKEVLYLMKEHNLSFSKCLKTREINKFKFDEVERQNNSIEQELFLKYQELLTAIKKDQKVLDFDVKIAVRTIEEALGKLGNRIEYDKDTIAAATVGIVVLGEKLGVDTGLYDVKEIINEAKYGLSDYLANTAFSKDTRRFDKTKYGFNDDNISYDYDHRDSVKNNHKEYNNYMDYLDSVKEFLYKNNNDNKVRGK